MFSPTLVLLHSLWFYWATFKTRLSYRFIVSVVTSVCAGFSVRHLSILLTFHCRLLFVSFSSKGFTFFHSLWFLLACNSSLPLPLFSTYFSPVLPCVSIWYLLIFRLHAFIFSPISIWFHLSPKCQQASIACFQISSAEFVGMYCDLCEVILLIWIPRHTGFRDENS